VEATVEPSLLTLPIARRVAINVGRPGHVNLTMVGCGGTGSFLALHLARLAWHCRDAQTRHAAELHLAFVDPDVVEANNIGRQNFAPAEIGKGKAEALARRYSLAFGLPIRYVGERFKAEHVDRSHAHRDGWLHVVIGCVDNTAARRDIAAACKSWGTRLWWLDCGNHDHGGQVSLGNRADLKRPDISPLGFCTGLPLPSVQHPELVERRRKTDDRRRRTGRNCAIDLAAGAQSLMINQMVAGWAASMLYRLVVAGDLDAATVYLDLAGGSARSEYILS